MIALSAPLGRLKTQLPLPWLFRLAFSIRPNRHFSAAFSALDTTPELPFRFFNFLHPKPLDWLFLLKIQVGT
jgi:hypothetical protein